MTIPITTIPLTPLWTSSGGRMTCGMLVIGAFNNISAYCRKPITSGSATRTDGKTTSSRLSIAAYYLLGHPMIRLSTKKLDVVVIRFMLKFESSTPFHPPTHLLCPSCCTHFNIKFFM